MNSKLHRKLFRLLPITVGLALIAIALLLTFVVNSSSPAEGKPVSLVGTWTGETDTAKMIATVTDSTIEIMWKTEDTTALYWKGSFNAPANFSGENTVITSDGDLAAMENSILASRHKTKTFTYDDGELSFELTVMGVTKTIKLSK